MQILEYGNPELKKIILIHGFESPYQIWNDYTEYYKEKYCVIVPILPGHNVNEKENFESFHKCAEELEKYYITKHGSQVFAIYGMSMGGVFASHLWKNQKIAIDKLIMESSPLLGFEKFMMPSLTKQYLTLTHKAQARDKKVVKQAINTMITEDKLDIFMELLDHISDTTIINYMKAIGQYKLPDNIDTPNTEIYYLYGGKINEILFRKVARFIEKNYSKAITMCLNGKGHCEDALLKPQEHIKFLDKILAK